MQIIIKSLNKLKKNKIVVDLVFNYASLGILGSTGLALNIFIAIFYTPDILGIFNQSLAFYMFVSMIGSFGINFSVLEAIPKAENNKLKIRSIIHGSLLPTLITSALVTLLYSLSLNSLIFIFNSQNLYKGLISIIPAIFFCSLNKVLLYGVYNGLRRMREFAIFLSLRYILILLSLFIFLFWRIEGNYLPLIFSLSEVIIFPIMIYRINKITQFLNAKNSLNWSYRHLKFGSKAVFTGLITEANTKVDIIMIGVFLNDNYVGIYSFAALIVEGYIQLIRVIQNNYNPIFSNLINIEDSMKINNMVKLLKKRTYLISIIIALILVLSYLPLMRLVLVTKDYFDSFIPFLILMVGISGISGFLPFYEILSMAKLPGQNTLFMIFFFLTNIIMNLIFIPIWGINGAAIATSIAYVSSSFSIKYLLHKHLKIYL